MKPFQLLLAIFVACIASIEAFQTGINQPQLSVATSLRSPYSQRATALFLAEGSPEDSEIVGKRITVTGDVQGGYYRSCVANEAGRFRRLVGTMSPPDDSQEAEIYVEGKRKTVDGFIRWCERGSVGLSQVVKVSKVIDEDPTGLYDGFYVKTK